MTAPPRLVGAVLARLLGSAKIGRGGWGNELAINYIRVAELVGQVPVAERLSVQPRERNGGSSDGGGK